MVAVLRCNRGGILGLLTLSRDAWEAIEVDLLRAGWTLADVPTRVGWRAILAMLKYSDRGSAIFRHLTDGANEWDMQTHLLASLLDVARWLQWAKTPDGAKNRNHPKPIPRPGDSDDDRPSGVRGTTPGERHIGNSSMTVEEARKFLGWGD